MKKIINVETKLQCIYYEDSVGKVNKFYTTSNKRITLTEALKILRKEDVNVTMVIRVMTERVFIDIPRDSFDEMITHSERYYKN